MVLYLRFLRKPDQVSDDGEHSAPGAIMEMDDVGHLLIGAFSQKCSLLFCLTQRRRDAVCLFVSPRGVKEQRLGLFFLFCGLCGSARCSSFCLTQRR